MMSNEMEDCDFTPEQRAHAAKYLGVGADWRIRVISIEAKYVDMDLTESIYSNFAEHGAFYPEDIRTILDANLKNVCLPDGWRMIGMTSPGGTQEKYGLVDFSAFGAK